MVFIIWLLSFFSIPLQQVLCILNFEVKNQHRFGVINDLKTNITIVNLISQYENTFL